MYDAKDLCARTCLGLKDTHVRCYVLESRLEHVQDHAREVLKLCVDRLDAWIMLFEASKLGDLREAFETKCQNNADQCETFGNGHVTRAQMLEFVSTLPGIQKHTVHVAEFGQYTHMRH